jgi:cytochrome P450
MILTVSTPSLIPALPLAENMNRLAMRPFTFSNGVTIPAGTIIAAPSSAIHMDKEIYSDPQHFDGFRSLKLSVLDGDVAETKYQAVTTSPRNLAFGFGRHAW